MGKHYYSTCILLHLVVLLGFGFRLLEKHAVSHADTERIFTSDLNETTLAFGGRILLSTAGIYELELIPGISDVTATRLITKRDQILKQAAELTEGERYLALTAVRGIGKAKAKAFAKYLDIK